jgi:2-polyprenyl-3-methyl-5-hydroxy-6-metoxy-1,4-benzoquinol methylase
LTRRVSRATQAAHMRVAVLYPYFAHPAIEERYGSWQSQLFLRRAAPDAEWVTYSPEEDISEAAGRTSADYCLVVTDPLLLAGPAVVITLSAALSGFAAAIPVTNAASQSAQLAPGIEPYLTIRQFQDVAERLVLVGGSPRALVWDAGDPGLFLSPTAFLRTRHSRATEALDGETVAVAPDTYVHRWTRLRSQPRTDLLPMIPGNATNILEFGCAEGVLGEAVKARQNCRFVGIEIDPLAAARAQKRLDRVYSGDATELIETLAERFDCIIGGDVLEHLSDPWSFLIRLRKLASPDALLLLSVPNVANWAIVADLLRGRFDYAYIAIACAGHLRFFGRNTIADALEIAGWSVEAIEPQPAIVNQETASLLHNLAESGIRHDPEGLVTPGFYVRARPRP